VEIKIKIRGSKKGFWF